VLSPPSHPYLKLPLIPLEDFLAQFPEHRESDERALIIARIEHERAEREQLQEERRQLLMRKELLIAANNTKKETLAGLDEQIEKLIDVSRLISLSFLYSSAMGENVDKKRTYQIERVPD
jgi:hypothetical protein